ncbi:MAG: hypothetical protein JWQ17_3092 [Tardiphaga sp.]|nr:hypothetical protein [Tardiphaga sp.]
MYWKFGCDVIRPDLILVDRREQSALRALPDSTGTAWSFIGGIEPDFTTEGRR